MKTSVRFLSLILAVVMIAGMAITASADNNDKIANEEALDFLVNLGVFGGYDDGSLKPNELVQRDEMAKIIFVLYTTFSEAGTATESFSDVPADNWAAGYVSWCAANGIVGGYGNGKFGPDDNVTYDQALKMVCGALGYKDWDSRFWPTDVRRTALTTLGLGENVSGVNGSDYVTRAQIAQIVYNALYAQMNETKKGDFGLDVPMTLIADIWGVTETEDTVLATEKLSTGTKNATDKEDEITLDLYGDATLEELGLEKYNGKTDDLIKARVNIIKRNGEIIGTTVKSVFEENVKITLNKDNELCLNGEVLSEKEVAALSGISIDKNGKVTETTLVVPSEDLEYVSLACDEDADGVYDWVEWNYYSAYEVKTIGKSTTTFAPLAIVGTGSDKVMNNDNIESKVVYAEEDVVVIVDRGFSVEVVGVIAPTTASATKIGADKITIGGTEYGVNEVVFSNVNALALDGAVLDLDKNGDAKQYDFYIYNGNVFYAPGAKNTLTENNYAVLAYINTPEDPILDAETQKFTTVYSAVLVIDGKETKVSLNPVDTVIDTDDSVISIQTNAAKLLKDYGKAEHIILNYLQPNYTLVTYTVNEDGLYTLKLVEKEVEDYVVLEPGATIAVYNGRYQVTGKDINGDDFDSTRVQILDSSALYYPYTKEETGLHKYLGVYTYANIYDDFYTAKTEGYTYLVKDENSSVYTLEATMLGKALKEKKSGGDYRTDGRLIKYCYSSSTQEYLIEEGGVFSSHYLMDMKTLTNSGAVLDKSKMGSNAQTLTKVNLYAYDEDLEEYVKITADRADVTSVSVGTVKEIFNGYLFTTEGKYSDGVKISDSAVLWTFTVSVNGDKYTSSYKQLTLDDIKACLDLIESKKEAGEEADLGKDNDCKMDAIFFTYKDAKGEEQISSVFFDFWTQNDKGVIFPHSTDLFDNFGA